VDPLVTTTVDEKHRSVGLTEQGIAKVEKLLNIKNLYDPDMIEINHHVQQILRAHVLYLNDREYVVKDGQVIIVDEFTGRLMPVAALERRSAPGGWKRKKASKSSGKIRRWRPSRSRITSACSTKLAGMDRYGRNRSGGIREDLHTGCDRHSDAHADGSYRQHGPGLPARKTKIPEREPK